MWTAFSAVRGLRRRLDALKADVTPAPVSAQPLRDLKRQLRRKKLTAVLLAVTASR